MPIRLERDLPEPLQDQLAAQLRGAIMRGQLAAHTRMPSTRTLAGVLGISRGVALAAYERLLAEGHIAGHRGSGTYVSGPPVRPAAGPHASGLADRSPSRTHASSPSGTDASDPAGRAVSAEMLIDLRSVRPSTEGFPLAAWQEAWGRADRRAMPFTDPPTAGLPALRAAIAAYLRDTRGLALDGHEVIVTAGQGDALELIMRAQGGPDPVIALEDPAPPQLRTALGRLGTVLPLPADGVGARPDLIPAGCDVAVVRPDRGSPLGTRMPIERRRALAAWARDSGGLVLEPAFDGLFTTEIGTRPSVLAIGDPWATAMVGAFRDLLTPTLRLSFALVPRRLAGEIKERVWARPSLTCQLAVTDLLTSGVVRRRAERLSILYAAKRSLVRQALGAYPGVRLLGAHTGAAATLLLPAAVPAESVVRLLRARRVLVAELAAYHHLGGVAGNGIVFNYGHLDAVSLHRALQAITRALADHHLSRRTAA
ncbi:PLP-dependent aminotransferase family protein [Nonomuraea insulae]|uniref:PLP-dependent aminotransferase family protein n=1 Tax=Nonomuraea insulae TaxID=1616787 RepID=A0ABW1CDX7_9ACTN